MRQMIPWLLILGFLSTAVWAETVGVFYDSTVPQASFAASDLQGDLEQQNHTVELRPLTMLKTDYSHKRIVLTLASAVPTMEIFQAAGGEPMAELGEQAFALRTTNEGQQTHWVFGGDINGLMYGGLQLAETIRFRGLAGQYNSQESPHIKYRGVKYNLPLDARVPTYCGYGDKKLSQAFGGDAARQAIPAVWDMQYWQDWFDQMARDRFNVISIWNSHPFPALLDMEEAVEDVQGFNGYGKTMSKAEKVKFWQEVMAYAKGRGFKIYFITWNIYTFGVDDKHGINNDPKNEATKKYFRKAVRLMFESYPDLDGIGVTAGENMNRMSAEDEGKWMWESYGQGMLDFAQAHPERDITFIHRWHYANITQVMNNFEPLLALPNVRLDMSYKYSAAHMYSTVTPKLIYTKHGDVPADLRNTNKKTWLEVRQDDFYFLHWGHPQFARDYIQNFPDKDRYIQGFFYGGDGWTQTRDFFSKTEIHKNILDIKRHWYTQKLWGRLAYNPHTPDKVFIDEIAHRYPQVSAADLFDAWSHASRGLPLAAEVIQGTLCFDFNWWPELCQSGKGFLTIDDFIKAKPSIGSQLGSIKDSAAGNCQMGLSSYDVADTVQRAGEMALDKLAKISTNGDPDLDVNLKHIRAQAYLSLYYAEKIRAATSKAAGRPGAVTMALGQAKHHWKKYVDIMDGLFIGAKMLRTRDFEDWHVHDKAVAEEYAKAAGIESPESEWGNDLYHRIAPSPVGGGFEMEDYWVWGSSVVKDDNDGLYHMFVARWPKKLPFHPGWMVASEVVHAVSETPKGPYRFSDVALGARGAQYWDGQSIHNPRVLKHKDTYVMYYMGSTHPFADIKDPKVLTLSSAYAVVGRSNKRIGIATSKSPYGPWVRRDKPVLETKPDTFYSFLTSNPAPWISEDGSAVLIFKSRQYNATFPYHSDMFIGLAKADHYEGPYEVASDEPIFGVDKVGEIEDPFLWRDASGYHLIAKDQRGKITSHWHAGVLAHSLDAVTWHIDEDPLAYVRKIRWNDGTEIEMGQLERPFGLIENGKLTHLFFATMDGPGGFGNSTKSWNMVVPLK